MYKTSIGEIMVEIYSYDTTPHERYARDQNEIEAFRKQYHLPPSGARQIALQTKVLDFIPKHSAIGLLMQTYQGKTWARFEVPKNYHNQRFLTSKIAPSLGSPEKQEADIQKLESFVESRAPVEKLTQAEVDALKDLLQKGVMETNEMVDFVFSRMHQFIQA